MIYVVHYLPEMRQAIWEELCRNHWPSMSQIITEIRERLRENADEATRLSGERFFKEAVKQYGVKTAIVSRIGKECFKKIPVETEGGYLWALRGTLAIGLYGRIVYRLPLVVCGAS